MDDFVNECLLTAEKHAETAFRGRRDREELVARTVSMAWQLANEAPEQATSRAIANFAIKRVKSGRDYQESQRSISHQRHSRKRSADQLAKVREEENPAFIAQVTIDFSEFWQTLTLTQQTIALYYQRGYRTNEIAELIGVSAGRISQIRKELRDGWQEFIGEE